MTALTPQQMRELADAVDWPGVPGEPNTATPEALSDAAVALRTAADTLEAVRKALDESIPPINCELRPDGSEDPIMSAYVDGARDVYVPVNAALNGASRRHGSIPEGLHLLEGGRAVSRPWWFIAGHVMFQSSSDAIRAKQETPLFLHQVAESQRRAADSRKSDAL